jgi:hypothetical protein
MKQANPDHSGAAGPRRSFHWPPTTMPTTLVARVTPNASAYSGRPSSARATVGIAAATAMDSKATSATRDTMPSVVVRCGGAKIDARGASCGGTSWSKVVRSMMGAS